MLPAPRRATTTSSGRWSSTPHVKPATGCGACRCTRTIGSCCAARSPTNSPAARKASDAAARSERATAGRAFLAEQSSCTGSHLSRTLGVVELTFALHRVFDSPSDAIVWDTGHQAYVHTLVTGRAGEFPRLRQAGGMSGYPSRKESQHDLVENSHASTSLSYALGLAEARLRKRVGG